MPAIIAIISIISFFVGQLLVTKRCCSGFLVWAASNLMVAAASIVTENIATTCMFAIYFLANTLSFITWNTRHEPS